MGKGREETQPKKMQMRTVRKNKYRNVAGWSVQIHSFLADCRLWVWYNTTLMETKQTLLMPHGKMIGDQSRDSTKGQLAELSFLMFTYRSEILEEQIY